MIIDFEDNMQKINLDSSLKNKKIVVKNSDIVIENARITQTNFGLNYNHNSLIGNNPEVTADALEDLNKSMITWNINPEEWNKEVIKVEHELQQFYSKLNQEETYPINDCLTHTKIVKEWLKPEVETKLNTFSANLSSDLYYISKEEKRMNSNNSIDIRK